MEKNMTKSGIVYVVRYSGAFGYIKPWTAVRDAKTYSQSFLTPSIIEGMRQKLEVSKILRHRIFHFGLDTQQERTQSAGWKMERKQMSRQLSIIERGIMLQPILTLAFETPQDAINASTQHICLCRNEDILLPFETYEMTVANFDTLPGIELIFEHTEESFLVGYNRFDNSCPMYGHLLIVDENLEGIEG